MDALDLARLQFAATTVYHFFFVPLTIGLSLLVAIIETAYVRTGDVIYKKMAKFWGKLFVINFAMGVVTGIVMEFQFGMNWSEYSRFVGDIFGAPLAIEALMAFFLESTFIGVWIFGWDKLSKGMHAAAAWLVALGTSLSALWILIANSFMQQPVGFELNPDTGRAEMTDFFAVLTNPNVFTQYPHVIAGGVTTAAFFVLGVSAYHLLRKTDHTGMFHKSFQLAMVFGFAGIFVTILMGHSQAQHLVETQPMKMAAAEALWNTEDPASMSILTIGDLEQREEVFSIRLPSLLSILAYNTTDAEVQGINNLQEQYEIQYADRFGEGIDYRPPIAVIYWSFRIMVGAGFLMLGITLVGLFLMFEGSFANKKRFLQLLMLSIALPYLANTSGWIMTEMGRVPWIVFGEQLIEDAISPNLSANTIAFSLVVFTLIYGAFMGADIYLLSKFSRQPVESLEDDEGPQGGDDKPMTLEGAYAGD